MALTKREIRELQTKLNWFSKVFLKGQAPLIVDGDKGVATDRKIKQVKFFLGFLHENVDASVTQEFRWRLWHPRGARRGHTPPDRGWIVRGMKRRITQRRNWRRNHRKAKKTTGVGTFDGRPVANALIPHLQWARAHGWHGTLVSGYRTPEYSEHLCIVMCGAPRCPGRCAGRATNHAYALAARFAGDVSDYIRFGQIVAHSPHNPRIFNALPNDRVHYSPTGG